MAMTSDPDDDDLASRTIAVSDDLAGGGETTKVGVR